MMKKHQGLTFKVLNTERHANGEVKLELRSNQRVTPAMRRAMHTDSDVAGVTRGGKPDKVAITLKAPTARIAPSYERRSTVRQMLVEDLTALAAKAA